MHDSGVELPLHLFQNAHHPQAVLPVAARRGILEDAVDEVLGLDVQRRPAGNVRDVDVAVPHADVGQLLGGVTVYRHLEAIKITDRGQGTARTVPLMIRNAKGLKVGFLARGTGGVTSVPFNMADKIAGAD